MLKAGCVCVCVWYLHSWRKHDWRLSYDVKSWCVILFIVWDFIRIILNSACFLGIWTFFSSSHSWISSRIHEKVTDPCVLAVVALIDWIDGGSLPYRAMVPKSGEKMEGPQGQLAWRTSTHVSSTREPIENWVKLMYSKRKGRHFKPYNNLNDALFFYVFVVLTYSHYWRLNPHVWWPCFTIVPICSLAIWRSPEWVIQVKVGPERTVALTWKPSEKRVKDHSFIWYSVKWNFKYTYRTCIVYYMYLDIWYVHVHRNVDYTPLCHYFLLGPEATGLRPSSSSFRARVRVKCLLIGAHDQDNAVGNDGKMSCWFTLSLSLSIIYYLLYIYIYIYIYILISI